MRSPHIPEISCRELGDRMHPTLFEKRIPLQGSLELTLRCNLHCVHCYCTSDVTKRELSFRQIQHILDEIAEAGCLWLLFTGGEPLVREDFLDIYRYAKKKGFLITLFTNGTLLTPYIADYLEEYPPFAVEISLYGISSSTYEKITAVEGSFKRCMQGIELLRQRNLPLQLKTMAMTLNLNEVLDIERYAQALGVSFRIDAALNSRLDGCPEPCSLRIPPEEVVRLDTSHPARVELWEKFYRDYVNGLCSDNLYDCSAGRTSFHISPYGELTPCMMSRTPYYDLLNGSFQAGWTNFIPALLAQRLPLGHQCACCKIRSLCNQCPGWGQFENGDPLLPVEYLCRIAHLRAQTFACAEDTQYLSGNVVHKG